MSTKKPRRPQSAEYMRQQKALGRARGVPELGAKFYVHGILPEDYDRMLLDQQGLCAICKEYMEKPCIDHDHKTGRVRGLLCHGCNTGIGLLREDVRILWNAANYLTASKRKFNDALQSAESALKEFLEK